MLCKQTDPLTVTFFMYLMFWVPHPGRPVPIFEDIIAAFSTGMIMTKIMIVVAMASVGIMAFMNIRSLVWNLSAFSAFRKTEAYQTLKNSNAESALLAMSVLWLVWRLFPACGASLNIYSPWR